MAYDIEKWVANERKAGKRHRWLPYVLLAMMVAMAASGVADIFDPATSDDRMASPVIFLLAATIASLGSPFARDAWLGPRAERILDEFELAALSRATTRSYSVMIALLVWLFCWLWLASDNDWPIPRTPADWSSIGFAVIGSARCFRSSSRRFRFPYRRRMRRRTGDPSSLVHLIFTA
jgi:hypothetical protein